MKRLSSVICFSLIFLSFAWAQNENTCVMSMGVIDLEQSVNRKVALGEKYSDKILLTAQENCIEVVARVFLPEGAEYLESVPAGELSLDGKTLSWEFSRMKRGETQEMRVFLRAQEEGTLTCCATVKATPICCVGTFVGKASLTLKKEGPKTATLGEKVPYLVTIKNTGNTTAKNIKLVDRIPAGLTYPSNPEKREVSWNLEDLPPGVTQEVQILLVAEQRGKFCNEAEVFSSNAESAKGQACTEVQLQDAQLTVECPPESYLGKKARYNIQLRNSGDAILHDVVVGAIYPKELKILSAENSSKQYSNRIIWRFSQLAPGEEVDLEIIAISKFAGKHCMEVIATCNEEVNRRTSCCTEWKGFPALLIEVIDTEDPLLLDETTNYVIKITNQGTALDRDIQIKVEFSEHIIPIILNGPTPGAIEDKNVEFEPYPSLNPKEVIEYRITAKAVSAGDARMRVYLYSELLQTPVPEEESTHVY